MRETPFIANPDVANQILQASGILEYAWAWEIIQRIVAHLPAPGFGTETSQSFALQINQTTLFRCLLNRDNAGELGWHLVSARVDRLEDYEFVRVVNL